MHGAGECYVSRCMARFLLLARIAGLAPLKFLKKGGGYLISFHQGWAVYGHVLIAVINLVTLISLVAELQLPQECTVRMRSSTRRAVWVVQSVFMCVASSAAVLTATSQMHDMIACFNQVQKINSELNILQWPKSISNKAQYLIVVQAVVCVVFSMMNYVQTLIAGQELKEDDWINAVYVCYFFAYWILQIRNLQFIMIVLHVKFSFTVVNRKLKNLLHDFEKMESKRAIKIISKNIGLDKGDSGVQKSKSGVCKKRVEASAVRRVSAVYASLCGVVRDVNRSHGPLVLLMLANFLLHLVCTPYYFITYLIEDESQARLTPTNITAIVMQLLWCLYHTSNLVMIVEPCHLTHDQMQRTRELAGQLLRCPRSPYDPLAMDLEQFFRYLALNNVYYEPMKFAKMSRALIFTLLGSITTYTVVILRI